MDSNDLERERGITILAKVDVGGLEGHAHQHRRHARPCRLRRRGRAHPQHGRRRDRAGRRGRGPDAADQVRGRQGAQDRAQADRRGQQGRQVGRAPDEVVNEIFDLFAALDASDEQLDFPILYGSAKQGWMADGAGGPAGPRHGAAVRPRAGACRGAAGRGRAVPDARHHPRGQSLSRPHHHRPHHLRDVKPNRPIKALGARRQGDRAGAHLQGARLPRPRAPAGRARPRRATSSRSPASTRAPSPTRSARSRSATPLPAQPIDPPTVVDDLHRQRCPLAGTEGDKVTSRVIRDRLLKEAEGNVALQDRGMRRQGQFRGRRTRRTAARAS